MSIQVQSSYFAPYDTDFAGEASPSVRVRVCDCYQTRIWLSVRITNEIHNLRSDLNSSGSQHFQSRHIPIKNIRVSTIRKGIRILPYGLIWPAAWNGPWSGSPFCQDQRTSSGKDMAIARAGYPPIRICIDHWITSCFVVISVDEILNPGYHGRSSFAVTFGFAHVGFQVNHSWKSDTVAGPASAMC